MRRKKKHLLDFPSLVGESLLDEDTQDKLYLLRLQLTVYSKMVAWFSVIPYLYTIVQAYTLGGLLLALIWSLLGILLYLAYFPTASKFIEWYVKEYYPRTHLPRDLNDHLG